MKRVLSFVLVFVLLLAMVPVSALAEQVETTPMYRLYNPNSGEHFYTGSLEEKDNLVAAGWNYEGIAWNAPTKSGDPVYRLYNPNSSDHHYTMSAAERDMLVGYGWQYEGVCWNSVSPRDKSAVPLFRLYNPNADCGSHHYTTSAEERDNLVAVGWILEGIGWFGVGNHVHSFQGGFCTGCGEAEVAEPSVEVKLSLDQDYIEMDIGDTVTIKATYSGSTGSPSWSSSDSSVATVSDGKVTAKGEGVAVISATYGGKTAQCVISASQKAEDTEPEIGKAETVWKSSNNGSWSVGCVGNSLSFNAGGRTADGDQMRVTVFSSDTGVATVSESANGSSSYVTVSFKGSGTTVIKLTAVDGEAYTEFTINVRGYSAMSVSTPQDFVNAVNSVVQQNGCSVSSSGNYTVLTLSNSDLTWSQALSSGQTIAHRSFINGTCRAGCSYQGTNENGEHVFYLYTT